MISLSRRSILSGLIAAPAVIRLPGLLMPVKAETVWPNGELLRAWYDNDSELCAGIYRDLVARNNDLLRIFRERDLTLVYAQ